jgi:tetratricopeptide (TPR) repeat protein
VDEFCHLSISLATTSGNTKRHSIALFFLAQNHWRIGDYLAARLHACEAQRLARISADLYLEARAIHQEALAWTQLGNYKESIPLCHRARQLLVLCGMTGAKLYSSIMNLQAEVHRDKSEYREAHNIHTQILQNCPPGIDPTGHAFALLNLAEISLSVSAPRPAVQQDIERAKKTFLALHWTSEITMCNATLAKLYLEEGEISTANTLFKTCLRTCNHCEVESYCLEQLGNTECWGASGQMSSWTTVYLAHSIKSKEKLGIYKALQFLGDIFLAQGDEGTAFSLFSVALEGFTYMDVHRCRAECMLRLGDISKEYDKLLKAVELWDVARPLFERSSQVKQIEAIDKRIASVGKDVLEKHQTDLAHLAEINVPTGIVVEEAKEDVSDTEDLQ